jgi:hypothetical protein
MDKQQQLRNYDFDLLADEMDELGCVVSAADYHGMVCGRLIGNHCVQGRGWREQAIEYLGVPAELEDSPDLQRLLGLAQQVVAELGQHDFGFQLLLPPDSCAIRLRAQALGQWCAGFLSGLALAGQDAGRWAQMPAELAEGLNDLASIAQIEAGEDDAESDFMELCEYVRMVVLSAFAELVDADAVQAPAHSTSGLFQGDNKLH